MKIIGNWSGRWLGLILNCAIMDRCLGYVWALLKPLLTFLILNFVFSTIFNPKNSGIQHFSLQLLTSIMLFNFFSEGTMAGLNSLLGKSFSCHKNLCSPLDNRGCFDYQRDNDISG